MCLLFGVFGSWFGRHAAGPPVGRPARDQQDGPDLCFTPQVDACGRQACRGGGCLLAGGWRLLREYGRRGNRAAWFVGRRRSGNPSRRVGRRRRGAPSRRDGRGGRAASSPRHDWRGGRAASSPRRDWRGRCGAPSPRRDRRTRQCGGCRWLRDQNLRHHPSCSAHGAANRDLTEDGAPRQPWHGGASAPLVVLGKRFAMLNAFDAHEMPRLRRREGPTLPRANRAATLIMTLIAPYSEICSFVYLEIPKRTTARKHKSGLGTWESRQFGRGCAQ